MVLRILDTDPESKPRKRFSDDIVGRFRSGYVVGNRPASLEAWRVTTGDPEVAAALQSLLGGEEPRSWDAKGEDNLELFTTAKEIEVIIEPGGLRAEMVLWGRAGKAVRRCDGVEQKDPNKGAPCACPHALSERKDAAKAGHGCEPSVTVVFRLAAAAELGKFRWSSGSWTLARDIAEVEESLAALGNSPALAKLGLEVVEYTTQDGKARRFIKPYIEILGASA